MVSVPLLLTKTWRFFQSRDLAFVLLAVLAGAVTVATFLPQKANLSPAQYEAWRQGWGVVGWLVEFLSLNQIYSSWWFYTALILVLANTLVCTIARFGQELRRVGRDWGRLGPEEIGRLPQHDEVVFRPPQDTEGATLRRAQGGAEGERVLRPPQADQDTRERLRRIARWLEGKGWLVRWEVAPFLEPVERNGEEREGRVLRQAQDEMGRPLPELVEGAGAGEARVLRQAQDTPAPQFVIASEATQSQGLLRGSAPRNDTRDTEVGYLFAEKGWLSSLGSIVFHLSLLVIALGVVYSQMVRQEGLMIIAEGETVTEQRPDYLMISKVPLLGEDYRAFQVRLERFVPAYYQGFFGVDYAADLTIIDEGTTWWARLRVNEPVSHRGVTFVLEGYGFSPRFVWRDGAGQTLFDHFINLMVFRDEMVDGFSIPEAGLTVRARFFPDMVLEDGRPATRSLEPRNPVFLLEVSRGREPVRPPLADQGEPLFLGLVGRDQPVTVGEGTLTFADLKYWARYRVVKDPGMGLVFAGFWVGLGALVMRYLYNRKRLWGFAEEGPEGTRLVVGGRAEQFGAIFGEEFDRLLVEMRNDAVLSPSKDGVLRRSRGTSSGPR